ncbi:UAP56-interacting factor isoform X1 [Tachyglossus aculeatus]|uniref:UAP56-interacting factor isoform X1 n=1 Tax=Tachyglossus aculeatus TaxID=9261 RepID=UPI0018F306C4|nr:UAP56-interacting factor isoform X1 [Tachyglossus aculeatus]
MDGFGFGPAGSLRKPPRQENLEKIDMSLDDIIKLNKKEGRKQNYPQLNRKFLQNGARQLRIRGTRWGIQQQTGFVQNSRMMPGKRRPYGVITGLAAKKASGVRKGISPLNRPPLSEKNTQKQYPVLKRKTNLQRQNEIQSHPFPILRTRNQLNRRNSVTGSFTRSGYKLSQQKDIRQATFLFRRGLKVQAQVHPERLADRPAAKRTRQWRTSTTSGGILTVSIDNPGAVHSPIAQRPRLTRTPVPPFLMKRNQPDEKKIPKGVPLQFDINSVGKQTGITLNERFGILKEQRAALTQNKGSRFVTVG